MSKRRYFVLITLLFIAYLVSARFGLAVSAVNNFAALMWPPSALAVAALILFGLRLWPAVFLGAMTLNLMIGASLPEALGIAFGNTLEAVVAYMICNPRRDFNISLRRISDVVRLLIASVSSAAISASIGVLTLWVGGSYGSGQIADSWTQWWAGDALAMISIMPALLALSTLESIQRFSYLRASWLEKISFVAAGLAMSWAVLSNAPLLTSVVGLRGIYMLVPMLLWGSMRFGQKGAVVVTLTLTMFAVWNTSHGIGPFAENSFIVNLLHLFIFVLIMSVTGMFVGSVVSQREIERQKLERSEAALEVAKKVAEGASLAKSQFVANLSHELRTPLAAVIGFSEMLAEGLLDDEQRSKSVNAIRHNGEMISNLLNDTLDLSKIEAGKIDIRITQTPTEIFLSDMKQAFDNQVKLKRIEFTCERESSCPEVIRTDILRLRQILMNVIGNAVKFTETGKVTLIAKSLADHDGRPRLAFLVRDTGPGISAEDVTKLFTPFFQSENSGRRGTGLGLSLSRRLAQVLGGDLVLHQSERGVGSSFLITVDA